MRRVWIHLSSQRHKMFLMSKQKGSNSSSEWSLTCTFQFSTKLQYEMRISENALAFRGIKKQRLFCIFLVSTVMRFATNWFFDIANFQNILGHVYILSDIFC